MELAKNPPTKTKENVRVVIALACSITLAASITYVLYNYTRDLLKERLRERIVAVATTGATQIKPSAVNAVWAPEDMEKPEAQVLIDSLKKIRDANKDIRFAYILRRTTDVNALEFVVDSESLDSEEEQEMRAGRDLAEDELAPMPGDEFEVAGYPALRDEAFFHPVAENDLQTDQWSTQMSAYAPIANSSGEIIAVFGIDVAVDDYLAKVQTTFLPFVLFIVFLISLLSLLSVLLIRFEGERIRIFQEIDRQKDELLGIVSHQLAKPITAIKWNLELMLDGDMGDVKPEQKESLNSMQKVTHHLAELVNMILDVSRIQLGKMKLDPVALNLDEFFKEIIEVIEPGAKEKGIEFKKELPAKLPTVLLDKRYMRMTVENLLSNAVKYTPQKGIVELKVNIDDEKMYCHVRDTGCGIPKADQSKIFGKLFRASNVRNTVDGNGFGLYVAKGAIEGQGGKMWFESEEGKGTTFFFELPLRAANA